MLTCPHCLHNFEQPPSSDNPNPSSRVSSVCCGLTPVAQPPVLLVPPTPCMRVFSDSGGALVITSDKSAFPQPPQTTVQLMFNQPSPSVQLSFVLPPSNTHQWCSTSFPIVSPTILPSNPVSFDADFVSLSTTQRALRNSGWYYEGLSWQESASLLSKCTPGTFLIRDSSDPRFLFSLSVQTNRGPTSVRLHYLNGHFRLDAEEHLVRYVPVFNCVLRLVEYYIAMGRRKLKREQLTDRHVWVDVSGHMYSPILLTKPKFRKVPSLQHLSRLVINKSLSRLHRGETVMKALDLPPTIQAFLRDYPYTQ